MTTVPAPPGAPTEALLTQRLLASDPTTLAVLGEELKLSRERIRQIEAAALRKLHLAIRR